ncbi:MAG: hypothetical protein JXR95_13585 [Deltaproteobacteria bacterium]|nr:hypothetical protein [Deltaproteobacteria bacterium]
MSKTGKSGKNQSSSVTGKGLTASTSTSDSFLLKFAIKGVRSVEKGTVIFEGGNIFSNSEDIILKSSIIVDTYPQVDSYFITAGKLKLRNAVIDSFAVTSDKQTSFTLGNLEVKTWDNSDKSMAFLQKVSEKNTLLSFVSNYMKKLNIIRVKVGPTRILNENTLVVNQNNLGCVDAVVLMAKVFFPEQKSLNQCESGVIISAARSYLLEKDFKRASSCMKGFKKEFLKRFSNRSNELDLNISCALATSEIFEKYKPWKTPDLLKNENLVKKIAVISSLPESDISDMLNGRKFLKLSIGSIKMGKYPIRVLIKNTGNTRWYSSINYKTQHDSGRMVFLSPPPGGQNYYNISEKEKLTDISLDSENVGSVLPFGWTEQGPPLKEEELK